MVQNVPVIKKFSFLNLEINWCKPEFQTVCFISIVSWYCNKIIVRIPMCIYIYIHTHIYTYIHTCVRARAHTQESPWMLQVRMFGNIISVMIFNACVTADLFQMTSVMVSDFITEVNCWSLYFIIFFVINSTVK